MDAIQIKLIGYAGGESRFAIYRKRKADGTEWFAVHDAYTVTDAEVRKGKSSKCVRVSTTMQGAEKWCADNSKISAFDS